MATKNSSGTTSSGTTEANGPDDAISGGSSFSPTPSTGLPSFTAPDVLPPSFFVQSPPAPASGNVTGTFDGTLMGSVTGFAAATGSMSVTFSFSIHPTSRIELGDGTYLAGNFMANRAGSVLGSIFQAAVTNFVAPAGGTGQIVTGDSAGSGSATLVTPGPDKAN